MSVDQLIDNTKEVKDKLPKPRMVVQLSAPSAIYNEMLGQIGTKDMLTSMRGQVIGSATLDNSVLTSIESTARASSRKETTEFEISTRFSLANHTYVPEHLIGDLARIFEAQGYKPVLSQEAAREILTVTSSDGVVYRLLLGFPDAKTKIDTLTSDVATSDPIKDEYRIKYANQTIKEVKDGDDMCILFMDIVNMHPQLGPAGMLLESQDQVEADLRHGAEVTQIMGNFLLNLGKWGNPNQGETLLTWRPKEAVLPLWLQPESYYKAENLAKIPLAELNKSIVNLVLCLSSEKGVPGLIDKTGLAEKPKNILNSIEDYFLTRYGTDGIENPLELNPQDKSLLALGLTLKMLSSAITIGDSSFMTKSDASIAGVMLCRYGESQRDRFEFYLQQDRKFKYQIGTQEVSEFLLLHTKKAQSSDQFTRYELIQTDNLNKARDWLIARDGWGGLVTVEDVKQLNSILLNGIVPDRELGRFRTAQGSRVGDRIGATSPDRIQRDLKLLLNEVNKYILQVQETGNTDEETILRNLVKYWTFFDAIHPQEEGNGRTGTLLFESWYRRTHNGKGKFDSPRRETWALSQAMSAALNGYGSGSEYYFGRDMDKGDLDPLIEYVRSHLVT